MRQTMLMPHSVKVRKMTLPQAPTRVPVQRHVLLPDGRRSRELAAGTRAADWELFLMGGTLHLVGYLSEAA